MNSTIISLSTKHERSGPDDAEALSNYRERRAFEELERAERKRAALAEQYASASSADVRVRAWERVHQLRMPVDPLHPVLDAIAAATRLTLAEVREEQRRRSAQLIPGAV
jgi:hypothetical protein